MTVKLIGLEAAADLIEISTIVTHDERLSSVCLELDHPTQGRLVTIQSGSEIYLITQDQRAA